MTAPIGTDLAVCEMCNEQAARMGVDVDWWCWMFGCSAECDCYGRETAS